MSTHRKLMMLSMFLEVAMLVTFIAYRVFPGIVCWFLYQGVAVYRGHLLRKEGIRIVGVDE